MNRRQFLLTDSSKEAPAYKKRQDKGCPVKSVLHLAESRAAICKTTFDARVSKDT